MATKKSEIVLNVETITTNKLTFKLEKEYNEVMLRVTNSDGDEFTLIEFGSDGTATTWGGLPATLGLKIDKEGNLLLNK